MDKKAIVLSVAGSDSSGGAGIQADIKAISALGGYAATAITAITVQNTLGVQAVHPVAAELVGQQMQAVMEDLQPDAIKIGMTGNVEIIYEIVRILRRYSPRKVVFDPVMVSTSGHSLMTDEALEAIRTKLIPKVTLVICTKQKYCCNNRFRRLMKWRMPHAGYSKNITVLFLLKEVI